MGNEIIKRCKKYCSGCKTYENDEVCYNIVKVFKKWCPCKDCLLKGMCNYSDMEGDCSYVKYINMLERLKLKGVVKIDKYRV